jgi:hypothetical protein
MHLKTLFRSIRSRHAAAVAIAAALTAGLFYARPADAGNVQAVSAALLAIKTDQNGTIEVIRYRHMNVEKTVNGCGAKIGNLPHLVESLSLNKSIELSVQDNCFKGVTVVKP